MKKTLMLWAGLLLASGTIFAEGKVDFSGTTVKVQELIKSSEVQSREYNDSDWGTNAVIKLNYNIDEKNSVSLKYETNDDDDVSEDNLVKMFLKRVDGPIEAQFALELSPTGTTKDIQEIQDTNETYFKYKLKDDLSVTVYPYNMGLETDGWFDDYEDNITEIPGIVFTKGKFDIGFGVDQASWPKETVSAFKTGYSFNIFKTDIKAQYSRVFYAEEKLHPSDTLGGIDKGHLGIVTQIANISLNKKLTDKLFIFGELAHNKLDKNTLQLKDSNGNYKFVNSGSAGIIGGEYQLTNKIKPYLNIKYVEDGFLGYYRQNEKNTPNNLVDQGSWTDSTGTVQYWDLETMTGLKTGGTTEYTIGVDYKLHENLILNLEGQYIFAGEKIFRANEDTADLSTVWDTKTKDTYFQVTGAVKFSF